MTLDEILAFLFLDARLDIDSVPFPEWTVEQLQEAQR